MSEGDGGAPAVVTVSGRFQRTGVGMVDHADQNGRRGVEMGDALCRDETPDLARVDHPKADMGPTHGGHTPCGAPAVAVEHGQSPQIDRLGRVP